MEGLRVVFRQPALGLVEVVWRWTSATVAWLLLGFLLLEYLDSLPVTKSDLFLLNSGMPALMLDGIRRMLLSGAARFLVAAVVCLVAICLAWVFAASFGRAATITALLEQTKDEHTSEAANTPAADLQTSTAAPSRLISRALMLLHVWRAALLLGTLFAFLGAAIVAGLVVSDYDAHPGIAFLLFLVLSWGIAILWYALDWLLSTAPIFAVRDGKDTFGAISAAVHFLCERFGAVARASAIFALVHVLIFFVASSLASAPLAVVRIIPPGAIVLSGVLLTLIYFVLVDFLNVARLAAYICIADTQDGVQPVATEC